MLPLYAVVNSGYTISGDIDLRQQALLGITVPSITSADLVIQGNVNTTSANFLRLLDVRAAAGGDLRFPTGIGSRMVMLPADFTTPPYIRIETVTAAGSLQADARTFTLLTRPR